MTVMLPDLDDLASEQVRTADAPEYRLPVGGTVDPAEEVVAAYPDGAVLATVGHGDAGVLGRVERVPRLIVVIQQTLEVGGKHQTVPAAVDIVVDVVGVIFR